jgi:hypothetical protein
VLTALFAAAITAALDDWGPLPKATDPDGDARCDRVGEVTSRRDSGDVHSGRRTGRSALDVTA